MSSARLRSFAKAKRRRQRQRRAVLAGGGGLALALASALSLASLTGVDVTGAAIARAQGFLDQMRQRSPGERTQAQLAKTKHHSRVLAEREELPPIAALQPVPAPVALLAPPLQPPLPVIPAAVVGPADWLPAFYKPGYGGGGVFAPVPGGGGGGGGGGGPGGPPQQPPQTPPPEQPPAVPEPGTWAMMLAGFGLIGCRFRRRHQGDRCSASA